MKPRPEGGVFCGASKKQNKDKDVRDNKKDNKQDN